MIGAIQGEGFRSPFEGQTTTVRGVVTHTLKDQGIFIQEERPDSFARVSHGLFVAEPALFASVSLGDLVAVNGVVVELGDTDDTLTSIGSVARHASCGPGAEPPDIDARLPLGPAEREAFEGMRVLLEQPLTVTAVRDVPKGQITLSALGILKAPTEIALPGEAAAELERKNRDWSLTVHNDALSRLEPYTRIHAGALVHFLSGVLGHDGKHLVLVSEDDIDHVPLPVPEVAPAAEGAIRVVSYNLYEYFNGDGAGGGFPGERGAETEGKFQAQVARIAAGIEQLRPDVIGVMELENDGFGAESAVQHLSRSVSGALDVDFSVATPQAARVGGDVISVGLLYRSDKLEAQGPAVLLEDDSFGSMNRVPLAQVLIERASGKRFLVVVNHLKSKGSCPQSGENSDQGDGQACWNVARSDGVRTTIEWAETLAAENDTTDILLVGDFNAYRLEDPVRAIEEKGLVELAAHHNQGIPQYSYVYKGAAGTLDYVFASPTLASKSPGAFIWHINAAYPYSARPSPAWLRSSDHDPVVVDLLFNQSDTSD